MCFLAIASVGSDLASEFSAWKAAIFFHNSLLAVVMHLPLAVFDTTPIGRILVLFSKDIDVLDNTLADTIVELFTCTLEVTM